MIRRCDARGTIDLSPGVLREGKRRKCGVANAQDEGSPAGRNEAIPTDFRRKEGRTKNLEGAEVDVEVPGVAVP